MFVLDFSQCYCGSSISTHTIVAVHVHFLFPSKVLLLFPTTSSQRCAKQYTTFCTVAATFADFRDARWFSVSAKLSRFSVSQRYSDLTLHMVTLYLTRFHATEAGVQTDNILDSLFSPRRRPSALSLREGPR